MTIYLTHFCVNVRQGQMCNLQTGQELETILISFYTFGILLDLKIIIAIKYKTLGIRI